MKPAQKAKRQLKAYNKAKHNLFLFSKRRKIAYKYTPKCVNEIVEMSDYK